MLPCLDEKKSGKLNWGEEESGNADVDKRNTSTSTRYPRTSTRNTGKQKFGGDT